ncbi:MAG: thioredoxin family protein [Arcicella sp.]|jgi:thiol:disulfide interchange protein|nr:thioredoxin family protein [Arcicella sp.]
MNKFRILAFAIIIFAGCRVAQQPQVMTQSEEEIVITEEPTTESEIQSQQGIAFFEGTLQAGLEKAKAENKLIFVDCYTTWCGPCKMLKQYTFKDANLGDYMKENYVCLAIDMEKPEGMAIAKKYGIEAYPTLLFLDKYGRVVNHQVGGIGAEALLSKAEQTVRKSM